MDDSGYFSVQVIAKALCVWNLQLESLTSPHMKAALDNPTSQQAFICNHESHWLTVRRLGQQWFNLNSLLKEPELISDTYLSLFLHQLQMEGYSIFVVVGVLPPCEADQVLSLIRADPPPPSRPVPSSSSSSSSSQQGEHHQHTSRGTGKRPGPQHFLKQTFSSVLSGSGHPAKRGRGEDKGEEQDLQMAMALSASFEQGQEQFEIDQQLQFQRLEKEAEGTHPAIRSRDEAGDYTEDEEEEAALAAAIYASLEDDRMRQTGHSTAAAAHTQKQGPLHTAGPGSGPERGLGTTAVEKGDGGGKEEEPQSLVGRRVKLRLSTRILAHRRNLERGDSNI
ncbi:Ataxin-3 [Geodia barretti]|nr:Ataxin-3 [Geodia barretti]